MKCENELNDKSAPRKYLVHLFRTMLDSVTGMLVIVVRLHLFESETVEFFSVLGGDSAAGDNVLPGFVTLALLKEQTLS